MPATTPFREVMIKPGSVDPGPLTQAIRDCSHAARLTGYLKGTGVLTAGSVIIEEADYDPNADGIFAGTWLAIATMLATSVDGNPEQLAYHFGGVGGNFAYRWVRVRIGDAIVGGSVSFVLVGDQP